MERVCELCVVNIFILNICPCKSIICTVYYTHSHILQFTYKRQTAQYMYSLIAPYFLCASVFVYTSIFVHLIRHAYGWQKNPFTIAITMVCVLNSIWLYSPLTVLAAILACISVMMSLTNFIAHPFSCRDYEFIYVMAEKFFHITFYIYLSTTYPLVCTRLSILTNVSGFSSNIDLFST